MKSAVQNFAEQNKLIIKTPNRIEDEYNYLKEINIDLAVVVAYGQIIPSKFWNYLKMDLLTFMPLYYLNGKCCSNTKIDYVW